MLKYAVAALALLAATPAVADANCSTKMLKGKWTIQMIAQGDDRQKYEMICPNVRIDDDGEIDSTYCGVLKWEDYVTTKGRLKLNKECELTGELSAAGGSGKERTNLLVTVKGFSDSLGNMLLANPANRPGNIFFWQQMPFQAIRQP